MLASSALLWYAARSSGLVAFGALTISIVLGLTVAGKARLHYWPRFAVEDVHRFAGILTGLFVLVHGAALFYDDYMPYSLPALLVPGVASYRPFWTALGVVSAELLAALALTNQFRSRMTHALWRRLHYWNFAVWALALGHGLGSGTDTGAAWALGAYAVSAGAVAGLTVWRILKTRNVAPWAVRLWPSATGLVAAEFVIALAFGPLAAHG